MPIQRKGQDQIHIERLTLIVYHAIDFLAPHFNLNPSKYRGRYPTVYLGPPNYGRGKLGLPIQTQEGDSCVGHETGHVLHEWVNSEVTAVPQLFGSPEYEVCEAVATYAQTLYQKKSLPIDIPFNLAQLIVMNKIDAERNYKQLERLTRRLSGEA